MTHCIQELRIEAGRNEGFRSLLFSRTERFAFVGDRGRLATRTISFRTSPIRIGDVTSTGHLIDLTEEDHLTLLMPVQGRLQVSHGRIDCDASARDLLAVGTGRRQTRVQAGTAGPHRAHLLMLPMSDVDALRRAADLGDAYHGGATRLLRSPAAHRMRQTFGGIVDDLLTRRQPSVADRIAQGVPALLRDMIVDLLAAHDGDRLGLSQTRVRLAEDMMRDRASDPLSIADVAQELGVGLRSLQLAFREVRGLCPRETLNRIRLGNARLRLLAAEPSAQVTSIALDSGFTHLSRFSETYRAAFGERPSETLRRSRPD